MTIGKVPKTAAERFAYNVQFLIDHRRYRPGVPFELESWVQSLSDRHVAQLGSIGVLGRTDISMTVRQLIDQFLDEYNRRTGIAKSTKKQFKNSVARFPRILFDAIVSDIEPKRPHHRTNAKPVFSTDARQLFSSVESFHQKNYAQSTWSRANGRLREVGVWAVENGICNYSPFSMLKVPGEVNQQRNVYVEREWVNDAMNNCLDPDTRLLFALGRYAGLRLPSEARTLKPEHVLWDQNQLVIIDSKKKRPRTMPLFDRIREELKRHRERVQGWDSFVLTGRTRENTDANNYGLMLEAVGRTQWKRWSRLRQNLRASCENDLLRIFDERLVTSWIGHTINVSRKHYQTQTEADFLRAVQQTGVFS